MKPCCLPNWAGTGSSHVLTKRGIICLSIPSLTVFFSIVAAYSGVAGLPAHPASTRAAAGRARSIVLLIMAFLLSSRAFGRSLRHAAPHEEPHVFILPLIDAPRAAKSKGATVAMLQDASVFGINPLAERISLKTNRARGQKACGPEMQMKMSKARACPPARCCRRWDCRS